MVLGETLYLSGQPSLTEQGTWSRAKRAVLDVNGGAEVILTLAVVVTLEDPVQVAALLVVLVVPVPVACSSRDGLDSLAR